MAATPPLQRKRSVAQAQEIDAALKAVFTKENWPDFYKAQEEFQGKYGGEINKLADAEDRVAEPVVVQSPNESEAVGAAAKSTPEVKEGGNFTTYGMEFELVSYRKDSPLANTAHVKLAEGNNLPVVPSVRNELVTDADNVVEYVSPVLVMPVDWTKGGADIADNMKATKAKLGAWGAQIAEKVYGAAPKIRNISELVADELMSFAGFTAEKEVKLSYHEIDETTDIETLLSLFGNKGGPYKPADLPLGLAAGQEKKWDFSDGPKKDKALGDAIQATVNIPLGLAAKLTDSGLEHPKEWKNEKSEINEIYADLKKHLPKDDLKDTPNLEPQMNMLAHRIVADTYAPFAVPFQAQYQYQRIREHKSGLLDSTSMALAMKALGVGDTSDAPEMTRLKGAHKDAKLDELFGQQKDEVTSGDDLPESNFTEAHSYVKDTLKIWSRTYLVDMFGNLLGGLAPGKRAGFVTSFAKAFEKGLKDKRAGTEAGNWVRLRGSELIARLGDKTNATFKTNWETKHFLADDPTRPDMRQDTLRPLEIHQDRGPMTLVELRDVRENTLDKVKSTV